MSSDAKTPALPFGGDQPVAAGDSRAPALSAPGEWDERQAAAANSALWAAWGDAVGWITELTDERGARRRTRGSRLRGPIPWTRKIGGRTGVNVDLPAGTYSDDTQLRLCVCRSYGPQGFDPEVFSAVELTVWPSYALGGGHASKAAASSMGRAGARWSANRHSGYMDAGGNGVAMRVQPHAWLAPRPLGDLLRDVLRDGVSTHGHPNALVGAALSALAVADALPGGGGLVAGGPGAWFELIEEAALIGDVAETEAELAAYWLPQWQHPQMGNWSAAVVATCKLARSLAERLASLVESAPSVREGYRSVIDSLDLRNEQLRGSGLHTVLAALALVELGRRMDVAPAETLLCAVHELGTDTDTIASMAGAILGCSADEPPGEILDREYIASEAARVAAAPTPQPAFTTYPDLLVWEPPPTQADALAETDGTLVVRGLGEAMALAEPIQGPGSEFAWQWVRLRAGQTLLIKRRVAMREVPSSSLPVPRRPSAAMAKESIAKSKEGDRVSRREPQRQSPPREASPPVDATGLAEVKTNALENALSKVRSSGYEARTLGVLLARLAREESAEIAAVFGAIVATELATLKQRDSQRT